PARAPRGRLQPDHVEAAESPLRAGRRSLVRERPGPAQAVLREGAIVHRAPSELVVPRRLSGVGWIAPLAVALVTLAAFLPVLGNGFVDWDDDEYILSNPYVRGLGWTEGRWMWTDSLFQGLYRPVALMTYGADYLVSGTAPFGYHLTSVLFHVANTLAV